MIEIYKTNLIKEQTLEDLFYNEEKNINNIEVGGTYVGTTMVGGFYKSAESGARVEILPDPNTGIVCWSAAATEVFKVVVGGTNVGDVTFGDYSGAQGAMWDQSAGKFYVKGGILASSLDIPDAATANSFHVDSSGNTWWGAIAIGDAVAKVLNTGAATFTNITITGGSVAVSALYGTISFGNLDVAVRGWSQTCAFSVTDANTVTWAAGVFTTVDGTAYNIGEGNTGEMIAKTYIYLDTAVSTTVYKTTTTSTTAVGAGKVLVAIAQNGTGEATFQVLDGQGGQNIDAANIVAGSITANEIAASTITAGKLSITQLSAIVANLGTITAGNITIDSSGFIRGGATDYFTGTGFFLGYSGGAYKFSVGNPAGDYMAWDGSTLRISGSGVDCSAGTVLQASADTGRETTLQAYTKLKEIVAGDRGTFTTKFDLRYLGNGYGAGTGTAYGAFFRNGVGTGTGRSVVYNDGWITWEENITDCEKGDLLQIYVYVTPDGSPPNYAQVRNFRIYTSRWQVVTD